MCQICFYSNVQYISVHIVLWPFMAPGSQVCMCKPGTIGWAMKTLTVVMSHMEAWEPTLQAQTNCFTAAQNLDFGAKTCLALAVDGAEPFFSKLFSKANFSKEFGKSLWKKFGKKFGNQSELRRNMFFQHVSSETICPTLSELCFRSQIWPRGRIWR